MGFHTLGSSIGKISVNLEQVSHLRMQPWIYRTVMQHDSLGRSLWDEPFVYDELLHNYMDTSLAQHRTIYC